MSGRKRIGSDNPDARLGALRNFSAEEEESPVTGKNRPSSAQTVAPGLVMERNVLITMPDGARLSANVFRPATAGARPAILSVTPYGKDTLPDRKTMLFMRLAGVRFGKLNCSRWTGFEAPDPVYWVRQGYVVAQADTRGMHASEGSAGALRDQDAADYAAFIAWAAAQLWCNGRVGLLGVSYLAMSQWRVAPLRPPALKAICPWEGVTDLLRELAYQDGIPETSFVPTWWRNRFVRDHNRRFPLAEDFQADVERHPFDDDYWAGKRPALEKIDVPALVCASWSDHGLHTRGSVIGYERIGSAQKWLFTHGRRKWETFYSSEAVAVQTAFFAFTLKEQPNAMEAIPAVRLERRRAWYKADVRTEPAWPLAAVKPTPLYLVAPSMKLASEQPKTAAMASYDSLAGNGRANFEHTFDHDTELTGGMRLKLWVSTLDAEDFDLFVTLHKLDKAGREVYFSGYNGYTRDCVAKGWLRASHRELDSARSTPLRPWHTHRAVEPIARGQIVAVEIEILPSSTLFEAGTTLRLDIQGHDAARYPSFSHKRTVNRGQHRIHCGGEFDSQLVVPWLLLP
jgi:hypothetical protein